MQTLRKIITFPSLLIEGMKEVKFKNLKEKIKYAKLVWNYIGRA